MKKNHISDRVKRMTIGFGLMFGLQMIVAAAAKAWLGIAGDNNNIAGIPLIVAVSVYFGGGLVMGLLSGRFIWIEPFLVTLLTVIINVLFFVIGTATDLTFISIALKSQAPVLPLVLNCSLVLLSALAGAFSGARVKIPVDDWISRGAMLFGILSLIIGPYLLLSASGEDRAGMPWYITAIIFLALLIIVGIGYALSMREQNDSIGYQ